VQASPLLKSSRVYVLKKLSLLLPFSLTAEEAAMARALFGAKTSRGFCRKRYEHTMYQDIEYETDGCGPPLAILSENRGICMVKAHGF
jgi:hypothetical protein